MRPAPSARRTGSPARPSLICSTGAPPRLAARPTPQREERAVQGGMAQPAVDDRDRKTEGRDLGAGELPVAEVGRHDEDTARRRRPSGLRDVLEARDLDPREQLRTPTAAQEQELDQALREVDEDLARQLRAFTGRQLGQRAREGSVDPARPRRADADPEPPERRGEGQRSLDRRALAEPGQPGEQTRDEPVAA